MTRKASARAGQKAPSAPDFDPVRLRYRRDGCTPERQVAFIRALAECGCVRDACRRVGLSPEAVYELARRPDAQSFRVAWDIAMDNAVRRIGDEAFSRCIHGVPVPHYYQGELIGEHRRFDERLTMFILRYRDPSRYGKHLDRCGFEGVVEQKALDLAAALDWVRSDARREAAGLPRTVHDNLAADNDDDAPRTPRNRAHIYAFAPGPRDEDEGPAGDDERDPDEPGEASSPPGVAATSSTSGPARNRAARRAAASRKRRR